MGYSSAGAFRGTRLPQSLKQYASPGDWRTRDVFTGEVCNGAHCRAFSVVECVLEGYAPLARDAAGNIGCCAGCPGKQRAETGATTRSWGRSSPGLRPSRCVANLQTAAHSVSAGSNNIGNWNTNGSSNNRGSCNAGPLPHCDGMRGKPATPVESIVAQCKHHELCFNSCMDALRTLQLCRLEQRGRLEYCQQFHWRSEHCFQLLWL